MARGKKESGESSRPVIAPAQPVASRPRRSTKDAFYDKLSTLTATKKMDINEEFYEYSPKPKAKKVPKRTGSSSSSADGPSSSKFMRPMLIHPNHESTLLPIRLSPPVRINGLHHYLTELRKPHLQLGELNIESIPIDPRMRFRCDLCFRRFPLQIDLELHLGTHVEDISACSLCDKPSKPFSMEEYTKHVSSHFIKEFNSATCIFCGEITTAKSPAELTQHLLYFCPNVNYCFICDCEIERDTAHQHRRTKHTKLMNRYVCTTCFLGFPSLSPFLSHICDMRYRCLCEMTDVFHDHHSINQHIDECDEVELRYHGILIPQKDGRKRCFFVNPHAVMPPSQNTPKSFGFYACNGAQPLDAGDSARNITFEIKRELTIKAPKLEHQYSLPDHGDAIIHYPQYTRPRLLSQLGPRIIIPRSNATSAGSNLIPRQIKHVSP